MSPAPRHARGRAAPRRAPTPPSTRRLALDALERIDQHGAYANLVLPPLLEQSGLAPRDRGFVTDLVYGTTRMRRACDFLVDRFLSRPPGSRVRNALRLGAYQVEFAGVPVHAAVAETVAVTPRPARGLVNAVLRKVATTPVEWPDDATRLSVPDWVLTRLSHDLGGVPARDALVTMNLPPAVSERDDGYVQDAGSQEVTALVEARAGERVLDACAAPGGKATALASSSGAWVAAADVRASRLGLVGANSRRLGVADQVGLVVADGTRPPWPPASFDRVLVDAPCSGLGTLRRRADLRWRVDEASVDRLAELQLRLLAASAPLVRPGGLLVYSVCTLTAAESLGVDELVARDHPDLVPLDPPAGPWEPWGRGAILLPQNAGTDGMCLFRYQRTRN